MLVDSVEVDSDELLLTEVDSLTELLLDTEVDAWLSDVLSDVLVDSLVDTDSAEVLSEVDSEVEVLSLVDSDTEVLSEADAEALPLCDSGFLSSLEDSPHLTIIVCSHLDSSISQVALGIGLKPS